MSYLAINLGVDQAQLILSIKGKASVPKEASNFISFNEHSKIVPTTVSNRNHVIVTSKDNDNYEGTLISANSDSVTISVNDDIYTFNKYVFLSESNKKTVSSSGVKLSYMLPIESNIRFIVRDNTYTLLYAYKLNLDTEILPATISLDLSAPQRYYTRNLSMLATSNSNTSNSGLQVHTYNNLHLAASKEWQEVVLQEGSITPHKRVILREGKSILQLYMDITGITIPGNKVVILQQDRVLNTSIATHNNSQLALNLASDLDITYVDNSYQEDKTFHLDFILDSKNIKDIPIYYELPSNVKVEYETTIIDGTPYLLIVENGHYQTTLALS